MASRIDSTDALTAPANGLHWHALDDLRLHPDFHPGLIQLAQDIASHHVNACGTTPQVAASMTGAMPCRVVARRSSTHHATVVGGLVPYHVIRIVPPHQSIACLTVPARTDPALLEQHERYLMLAMAPLWYLHGRDGVSIMRRLWDCFDTDEKRRFWRSSAFAKFAQRCGIKPHEYRKSSAPPVAQTLRHFEKKEVPLEDIR